MSDDSRGAIIAVVDDDEPILRSLEILLESADYAVRSFRSGEALLASGSLEEIDCLVSDIAMSGMDGFELLRLVQAARPGLPVILITGQPGIMNGPAAAAAGRYRVFRKPFRGPELLAAIDSAVAGG